MKKFLTVLLALSVVFTYTVGTAFATTVDKTPITDAQTAAYTAIDNAGTAMLGQYTFDKDGSLTGYYVNGVKQQLKYAPTGEVLADADVALVTKTVVTAELEKNKVVAKTAIQTLATSLSNSATSVEDVNGAVVQIEAEAQSVIEDMTVIKANNDISNLLVEQAKLSQKAAKDELKAYTTTQYSDDTDDWAIAQNATYEGKYVVSDVTGVSKTTDLLSAKAFVEKMIAKQLDIVESADIKNVPGVSIRNFNAALRTASDIINGHKIGTGADNYYVAPVPTKEDLDSDTTLATAKEKAIAKITAALATKSVELTEELEAVITAENKKAKPDTDKIAAAEKAIAGLSAQMDAAKESYVARINAQKTVEMVQSQLGEVLTWIDGFEFVYNVTDEEFVEEALDEYVQRANDVATLKAYAEQIIALVDREANPYFDETAVRDVLAKQVEKLYLGNTSLAAAKTEIKKAAAVKDDLVNLRAKFIGNVEGIGSDITIGTKTYKVWNSEEAYEDAQLDAFKANVDKTIAAINEATTYAEIKDAYLAGCKANEDIITIAQHVKDWTNPSGKLYKEYAKNYETDLAAYKQYALDKLDATDYSNVKDADTKITADVKEILEKAYTTADIPSQVAAAKAYLDSLKSNDDLDTAKKAVEAKIAALKTPVAVEDKAQILDAKEAYEDYIDLAGAVAPDNALVLKNCVEGLAALEIKAIKADIAALEKAGVTAADAEKIAAIEAAIDEYEDNYEDWNDVEGTNTVKQSLKTLQDELSKAQLEELAKLCAALPMNPTTKEDVAKVKAARAAFEALTIYQKATFVDEYDLYYDKLSQIETYLAKTVESLKIVKNHSVAGKGYIKIAWSTIGNDAAIDGFKVYRSTKLDSGYKYIFTTTNKTYKNTKSLKKGTRYYYKVKAYKVVDGKTYYSDYSNKAYRVAK